MGLWEEDHRRGKVPFLLHHLKGTYYRHQLLKPTLNAWLWLWFLGVSSLKLDVFPLSILYMEGKSLCILRTNIKKENISLALLYFLSIY